MMMMARLTILLLCLGVLFQNVHSFTPTTCCPPRVRVVIHHHHNTQMVLLQALPTPEESAAALSDYMAKAHEEKIRAMNQVETKYKDRIEELEQRVSELQETSQTAIPSGVELNSYHMPATNKNLIEKVQAYQTFLSDYVVKVQNEKVQAVAVAEKKMKDKYEAIIADLKKSGS